ncbi:hypothetical protein VTJ04DRAFT_9851 [Mycothermus thermophilus]|uniref:uncharacterized protein n=1 Tax=Humicola insolens TaxID=85995 RepID=UPI0037440677
MQSSSLETVEGNDNQSSDTTHTIRDLGDCTASVASERGTGTCFSLTSASAYAQLAGPTCLDRRRTFPAESLGITHAALHSSSLPPVPIPVAIRHCCISNVGRANLVVWDGRFVSLDQWARATWPAARCLAVSPIGRAGFRFGRRLDPVPDLTGMPTMCLAAPCKEQGKF